MAKENGMIFSPEEIKSLEADRIFMEWMNQSDEANIMKFPDDDTTSRAKIYLSGYDTSLPSETILEALCKHVSPCGKIIGHMVTTNEYGVLYDVSYVSVCGEGALLKAHRLNNGPCGCDDVKGCKIVVDEAEYLPVEEPIFNFDMELLLSQAAQAKADAAALRRTSSGFNLQ